MEDHDLNVLCIQETRTQIPEQTRTYNCTQAAAFHKLSQKYVSSGLITITKEDMVITKNNFLSTKDILVTDIQPNVRILNVYAQPDRLKPIIN